MEGAFVDSPNDCIDESVPALQLSENEIFIRRTTGMQIDMPAYAYYYTLRSISRQVVADSIISKIRSTKGFSEWNGLVLSSIDPEALTYSRTEWPKYYGENTHFGFEHSWEALWYKHIARPSMFDLAVWQRRGDEKILQGLALGKPSNGKTHLCLNWVERSFAPSYLRGGILLPVLACAEEYAKLLGCERVLIKEPVDPDKYRRYGYSAYTHPHVPGAYLSKGLKP